MAYATIAGLPVQVGLYTAFLPMVIYAVLGTSVGSDDWARRHALQPGDRGCQVFGYRFASQFRRELIPADRPILASKRLLRPDVARAVDDD